MTFVFLQIKREREWYAKFGYKGKWPQSYLSYFSTGFHWRIFILSRATRHCSVFHTGLKNLGPSCLSILLSSTRSRMGIVRLPATDPAQKLPFFLFTSAEEKGSPLPFWGPSQSFGFSLLPLGVRRPEVTKYQHMVSPVWPTFLPNGHLFDG